MCTRQYILDVMMTEAIDPDSLVKKFSRKVTGRGVFSCLQCKKGWSSHHTVCVIDLKRLKIVKRWRQKCVICLEYVCPSWKPEQFKNMIRYVCRRYKAGGKKITEQNIQKPSQRSKPHKSELCEACEDGICRALFTTDEDDLAEGIRGITLK